jgi:hypothetical protein
LDKKRRTKLVEGAYMLRSIVVDNNMLNWISKKLNEEIKKSEKENPVTRSMLSNLIWEYEKKGGN